jgi:hypothetical protein
MPNESECLPCPGYCKAGAICLNRKMAERFLAAVAEDRAKHITNEQIEWALQVTGDLPVAE